MKLNAPSTNWLIAAAVSFVVGCASVGVERQASPATADRPEPGKGLVIFYRESRFAGGGVGFMIRDIDKEPTDTSPGSGPEIGGLPNGSYFVYSATPGRHTFSGSTTAKAEVYYRRVDIESNHIYYVRAELLKSRTGGLLSSPELTVIDSQEGSAAVRNLRRVTLSR